MSTTQTQSQTAAFIRDCLATHFGRNVLEMLLEPRSNNTKVYILSLSPAIGMNVVYNEHYRRPSTEPLPSTATKAVMRFTNPDANLNDAIRVESEVASMAIARAALQSLDKRLVPRVYGWSSAVDGNGWVLMEFMSGSPLQASVFQKLEVNAKKGILAQIAQIVKLIQQCELPTSVIGYGGLRFTDGGDIVTGPTPIYGATKSCETYHELYSEYLQTQLEFMDKCDIVQGWKDTGLRVRIDEFVTTGFKPLLERVSEPNPRQTLVHGDFDLHNLLFDADTNSISGLLDFDFSHVASAADEYFYSFDAIHGLVVPPSPEASLSLLRKGLLHGFDTIKAEEKPTDIVDWEVAMLRDEAFSLAHVRRPVDMMPIIEPLSELYWFIQNISPGLFFLPRVRAKMTPERASAMRKNIQEDLERTLSGWGY